MQVGRWYHARYKSIRAQKGAALDWLVPRHRRDAAPPKRDKRAISEIERSDSPSYYRIERTRERENGRQRRRRRGRDIGQGGWVDGVLVRGGQLGKGAHSCRDGWARRVQRYQRKRIGCIAVYLSIDTNDRERKGWMRSLHAALKRARERELYARSWVVQRDKRAKRLSRNGNYGKARRASSRIAYARVPFSLSLSLSPFSISFFIFMKIYPTYFSRFMLAIVGDRRVG